MFTLYPTFWTDSNKPLVHVIFRILLINQLAA